MNYKTITVRIKNNYGTEYIYPVCPNAQNFADIADTKTLTPYVITLIKSLGFKVIVQPTELKEL